jgi:hypothetical protein
MMTCDHDDDLSWDKSPDCVLRTAEQRVSATEAGAVEVVDVHPAG